MVALEALACGTPVAGYPVGILPDLPGEVCRIATAGGITGLADAILSIFRSNGAREEIRSRSREIAVERFSLESCTEKFLDLYHRLMEQELPREKSLATD